MLKLADYTAAPIPKGDNAQPHPPLHAKKPDYD
jgi:hypothetical protein